MREERLYRADAVVLHALDYAETDRILTLLTPMGKQSVLAKGVRRAVSRKAGHLGLFTRVQLMLARGRNLDIITQAEALEEYPGLSADLLRYTYACYVGELVQRFAQEDEDTQEVYNLLLETLRRLAEAPDPRLWVRYYELRLLSYVGFRPELFACVRCGKRIIEAVNQFSLEQGGILCPECAGTEPQAIPVSIGAQKVLRFLQTRQPSEVEGLRISEATHAEVEALIIRYLEHVLEREVKSVAFLRRLQRELKAAADSSLPRAS